MDKLIIKGKNNKRKIGIKGEEKYKRKNPEEEGGEKGGGGGGGGGGGEMVRRVKVKKSIKTKRRFKKMEGGVKISKK